MIPINDPAARLQHDPMYRLHEEFIQEGLAMWRKKQAEKERREKETADGRRRETEPQS
jgi:hypothetical protein